MKPDTHNTPPTSSEQPSAGIQVATVLGEQLATDPEVARVLRVGMTKLFELQKQPDFPAPIWLGPRVKRHRLGDVLSWATSRTSKPAGAKA